MQQKREVPCARCSLWDTKKRSFTCNPDDCKKLTTWLHENAPHIMSEKMHPKVPPPEPAVQYVV